MVRSTSTAGTRPVPFLLGSRRSDTIACRFSASRSRTCWCSSTGKNDTTRRSVVTTSLVWIDENTAWPVSAALSAVSTVSASRISPTMITSGSWRSAARSAAGKLGVSVEISRCVMIERSWVKMNSTGSSIVTILHLCARLISWSMVASVVDLPMPVAPVTSTRPRCTRRDRAQHRGQVQLLEVLDRERDHAQHDVVRAALAGDVHAEAALARDLVGQVDLGRVLERLLLLVLHEESRDGFGVLHREDLVLQLDELAVEAIERQVTHLEVDVRRALLEPEAKQPVKSLLIHGESRCARAAEELRALCSFGGARAALDGTRRRGRLVL